ncbi:MAG TPA: hypothetical protein VIP53_09430 [Nitrososphaera sp.]
MTDQFAFLGDKRKASIAAMSLAVLLLLPASLGFGGTIIQEAFGQFNLPLLEEDTEEAEEEDGDLVVEEEETPPATTTTPPATTTTEIPDPATYVLAPVNTDPLRGFIGTTLPTPGTGGNAVTPADGNGYIVTGRSRVFANDSGIESFFTEMYLSAIDGSSFHNVTIREGDPHRFEATAGNETNAVSSSITGNIFLNNSPAPVIEDVPMTLTVRGQTLALEDIDIDETTITDPGQLEIISIIDGQSIYGTFPRA